MKHLAFGLDEKNQEKNKKNFTNGYYYGELEIIYGEKGFHFNWYDEVEGLVHEADEPLNYESEYTLIGVALQEQFSKDTTIEFLELNFKKSDFDEPSKLMQHIFWEVFDKTLPNRIYGPQTLTTI